MNGFLFAEFSEGSSSQLSASRKGAKGTQRIQ
jgi:hypothetical protein